MRTAVLRRAVPFLAFLGLASGLRAGAEPLLQGRVLLSSGDPVPGARVMLFDLAEVRLLAVSEAGEEGAFSLSRESLAPSALPEQFSLGQNYPNPFNPSTIIPYQLPAPAQVRLEVFNLLGQRIATLVNEVRPPGFHVARWDGTDGVGRAVAAGLYLYRLQSGQGVATRRMVLVDGQAGIPAPGVIPEHRSTAGTEVPVTESSVLGLTVSGPGLLTYVDPAFRVEAGMGSVNLLVEEDIPSRGKVATSGLPGDVDNNGRVDLVDALLVATYIADNSVTMPNNGDISQGDMNSDGRIDYIDVWLIATQFMLQQIGGQDGLDDGRSRMYWLDRGTDRIQRSSLDGSNVEDLVTTGLIGPKELALDVAGGKMYWTDNGTDKIQRANLDGSQVEDLVTAGLIGPAALELDVGAGKMYWTDQRTGKIQRSNLDGSGVEDLVTGLRDPQGLALDVAAGRIYWTDQGARAIHRANLDGSNIQGLVTSGLRAPTALALDTGAGKMYWTDWGRDRIQRADLDGSNLEDLVRTSGDVLHGLALDLAAGKMYWTDHGRGRIQRANLDGSNVEDLVTTGLSEPSGLALEIAGAEAPPTATLSPDPSSVDLLDDGTWHAFSVQASESVVVVANPAGTTPRVESTATSGAANDCPAEARDSLAREDGQTIYLAGCSAGQARVELRRASDQTLLRTYTFDIEEVPTPTTGPGIATIYWTTGDRILRADTDGGNVEDVVAFGSPRSLALDVLEGKIYWSDQARATRWIWRANLDGSESEAIVRAGLIRPAAIALDLGRGKIYWTDAGSNRIQRANLDGSNVEDLVSVGLHSPEGLALDVDAGKVYWSDFGTNKIQRANLDGSNVEDLVTSGLKSPGELALDVGAGKIYWTDYGTDKIQRANLDGSNVEDLVTTGLRIARGLALDAAGGKIYWGDAGTREIQRADLDGSNLETLVTRPSDAPLGLALADAVAFLSPNPSFIVLPRRGTWLRFEVRSTEPVVVVANPTGTPARILVSTTPSATGECPGQPEASVSRHGGQAVYLAACETGEGRLELRRASDRAVLRTYAVQVSAKLKIYWTDADAQKIQRADLDGSNVEDLVTTGLNHPIGLALDAVNGRMYWAGYRTRKIRRADLDGSNVEDLVDLGLEQPVGMTLDVAGGKMYWTSWNGQRIQRANLDGSNVEDLVTSGLFATHGLVLDLSEGKMYWTEVGGDRIRRANLDGSNVEDLITRGLRDPREIALDPGGGKMYWAEQGSRRVRRANLDGSSIEDLVTGLSRPEGLDLDVALGKMYWTDVGTGKIQRANLDGSEVEDLVTTGLQFPRDLVLLDSVD